MVLVKISGIQGFGSLSRHKKQLPSLSLLSFLFIQGAVHASCTLQGIFSEPFNIRTLSVGEVCCFLGQKKGVMFPNLPPSQVLPSASSLARGVCSSDAHRFILKEVVCAGDATARSPAFPPSSGLRLVLAAAPPVPVLGHKVTLKL